MTLSTMVPATLSMVLPNESIGVNDAANWLNDNAEFQNTCVTCNSMFGMMVRTVALIWFMPSVNPPNHPPADSVRVVMVPTCPAHRPDGRHWLGSAPLSL